ncbi:sigma-70 family RNA polymerase sigma factor [Pueribacillus sp. YX66]|uniref:sigma-70 family RNA polymerase sigma factor n=1 Tax=Pueribacillus sp. YX66 TaxID=3229242 RepID=UPI00358D42BA
MNNNSFYDVFQQYEKMIKNQIKSLNIYKNYDEFYQIGLIALWKAWQNYDDRKGKFSAYAYVSVRGSMLDQLRKDSQYDERFTVDSNKLMNQDYESYSETLLDKEMFESYLTALTEKQKTWAIEAILNEKTFAEIASEYGTTVEAVKSWRKGALKKLRKQTSYNVT